MITEKTLFGGKKLNGYPRLKHTAQRISKYIPKSKIYVEPFAGLGEVAKLIKRDKVILNDKSEYAINYLKENFPNSIVTQDDFLECMKKWDSEDTFFLIDPPWYNDIYSKNEKPFMDRTALQYYQDIFVLLKTLKGNWILCADKWEHDVRRICTLSEYDNLILKTETRLLHGKIGVLLTSNKPFYSNIYNTEVER